MKANINKSKLMKMAHSIFRNNQVADFATALKTAWKAMKLKAQMVLGKVEFAFRKADGSIRKAVGTLKDIASHISGGNANTRKSCGYTVVYFDIERNAIRSFRAVSLV